MDNFRANFVAHRLGEQKFIMGSLIVITVVLLLLVPVVTLHVSDAALRNDSIAGGTITSKALPPAAIGDSVIVTESKRAPPPATPHVVSVDWADRESGATAHRPTPPPPQQQSLPPPMQPSG